MKKHSEHSSRIKPTTSEIAVFAMLGSVMYASKIIMELAPNIHLVGVFTIAFTIVYRQKALYPIYIYVLLTGIFMDLQHGGFHTYIYGPFFGVLSCFFQ